MITVWALHHLRRRAVLVRDLGAGGTEVPCRCAWWKRLWYIVWDRVQEVL